jgi:chemotaxis family two-component system response regulator Rcp1
MNGLKHNVEILLVEDNPGDVRLVQEALKESRLVAHLSHTRDGVEALAFLRQEGAYANAVRPDLILLDLNLPRKDGREVLRAIKSQPDLRRIPVIVLTTSNTAADIDQSYDLSANCYIVKPPDLDQFMQAIHTIEEFWMGIARLPSRHIAS